MPHRKDRENETQDQTKDLNLQGRVSLKGCTPSHCSSCFELLSQLIALAYLYESLQNLSFCLFFILIKIEHQWLESCAKLEFLKNHVPNQTWSMKVCDPVTFMVLHMKKHFLENYVKLIGENNNANTLNLYKIIYTMCSAM